MKSLTRCMLIAFALLPVMSGRASARVQVFAQVDTSKDIYIGERFAYNVIIDGDDKPGQVDLTPLAEYYPQSTENGPVSQTSLSRRINGKWTQKVIKQYIMGFSLIVEQPGQIQIPPVTVTFGGKAYNTNPVTLNILKPGTTDKMDLELELSERQCYVGQPVIMTLKFYYSAADIADPQFNIPALAGDAFFFENPDISNPQEREYDLGNGVSVFVGRYRTTHKGKDSDLLVMRKVLIPKMPGPTEIKPATVSANVAVRRIRGGLWGPRYEYKRFMVKSEPLMLTVLTLPDERKPPEFYGLVGRYTISASATPTTVSVGDPMTLTIRIGGGKYLKPVQWPALEQVPEMAENFKIPSEKSPPTVEKGFKVFTQTIRANNDKVSAIPPIPLAFFDPDKGEYTLAKTEPIKLKVAPTTILTPADLEGTDFTPVNKEVEAIKKGLSANYEALDVLINQSFSAPAAMLSPGYAALWGLPFVALVFSSLLKLFSSTSPEKVAIKRRRSALARALRQLKKISFADPRQRPELLASIMKQYVGERFDRTVGSLTADDCHEVIIAATKDAQTADAYKETITGCEAARYAAVEANVDADHFRKVTDLVRRIEKKSRK